MTYKNQIWERANAANEVRCIALLKQLFPSLYNDAIVESGSVSSIEPVSTKKRALEKIKMGLENMTEREAEDALISLDVRKKNTGIKF